VNSAKIGSVTEIGEPLYTEKKFVCLTNTKNFTAEIIRNCKNREITAGKLRFRVRYPCSIEF